MNENQWQRYVAQARRELTEKNNTYYQRFALSDGMPWHLDLDQGDLVWLPQARPIVRANVQCVGSISRASGTWLWSWANDDIPERARDKITTLRRFGEAQGVKWLTNPEWPADETDGENMTAVSVRILEADGFFRDRKPDRSFFFVLAGIGVVEHKV